MSDVKSIEIPQESHEVRRQKALIAGLEAKGQPTAMAKALLAILRKSNAAD